MLGMRAMDETQRSREWFHSMTVPVGAWAIIRVDGRSFSKMTEAHYDKPFDARFSEAMRSTAMALVAEFDSPYGYAESDEISIVLPPEFGIFNRSVEKLVSLTAALASATFTLRTGRAGCFDSRIWVGTSIDDVADYCTWRQADATRAALNTAAYWTLRNQGKSAGKATTLLSGLTRAAKHDLLHASGHNFDNLPGWAKRGIGLSWKTFDHIGVDPRTDTEVPTTRRRIAVHDDLPYGEQYPAWVKDIIATTPSRS